MLSESVMVRFLRVAALPSAADMRPVKSPARARVARLLTRRPFVVGRNLPTPARARSLHWHPARSDWFPVLNVTARSESDY